MEGMPSEQMFDRLGGIADPLRNGSGKGLIAKSEAVNSSPANRLIHYA